jgi:GNAT superfamily N-acetyltransferase
MSVTIKRAELSDVSIVAYLFNQYRQWYHQQADLEGAVNFLRERLTNSDSTILLALVENEPAGFTQLYSIFSSVRMKKALLLNDLFVAKNARKKGVAAELLKDIPDAANRSQ